MLIVGAGIAGIATAFFVLRATRARVLLVERDRVGCGASGHSAGQLTTYFERPLSDIADTFGWRLAADAQRDLDDAHDLLDSMVGGSGARLRIERFTGYLAMFNRAQLEVHLGSLLVRKRADLPAYVCMVSEEADFVEELPTELDGLYEVVPQAQVNALLEIGGDRYRAVLAEPAGCSNSSVLCQQVLGHLLATHRDRFAYADYSKVEQIVVSDDRVVATVGAHRVVADHAVLCTNGFVDHVAEDEGGVPLRIADDQQITGRVAYMAGFAEDSARLPAAISYIRNEIIGGHTPYVYVTRRTYDRDGDTVTLTCIGGPEYPHEAAYDRDAPFPGPLLQMLDEEARPFAQPARPPGRPYDFQWHGLMGYNDCGLRVVGAHPRRQRLLYNLGCNGVGFLASIRGGHRIAELLAGRHVPAGIFDPRLVVEPVGGH